MSTKHKPKYKRIAQLKNAHDFREYLKSINTDMPFDDTLAPAGQSPAAKGFQTGFRKNYRQPVLHSADGRVGWYYRWKAQ